MSLMTDEQFKKLDVAAKKLKEVADLKLNGLPGIVPHLAEFYEQAFRNERDRRLAEAKQE